MGEKKDSVRATARLKRGSFSAAEIALWSGLIQEQVCRFPHYLVSRSVALYSPIGNEVATEGIRDHALKAGKRLFYPKPGRGENLAFIRVHSPAEFGEGRFGILEPTGDEIMTPRDQEGLVVFVPGLAFDRKGNRLGRGKGWYDRVLSLLGDEPTFVALAFEFQIVEELPTERWDRKVHHIITERRVIDCGGIPSRSGCVC